MWQRVSNSFPELRRRRRRLKLPEQLFLNPFQKWSLYGEFPITLILHIILVVLVTCQVRFYLEKDITHAHKTTQHLSKLMLGTSSGYTTFYKPSELHRTLESAIRHIFNIDDVTFNDVRVVQGNISDPSLLHAELHARNGSIMPVLIARDHFTLGERDYLRQLIPSLYSSEIKVLQGVTLSFHMIEKVLYPVEGMSQFMTMIAPFVHFTPDQDCFWWDVKIKFDGTLVGSFDGTLQYTLRIPMNDTASVMQSGLHIMVTASALACTGFIFQELIFSLGVFMKIRKARRCCTSPVPAQLTQLSLGEETPIFNGWWIISLTSHVLQVWSTLHAMANAPEVIARISRLGWSCFFTWLNLCQYFEFFPSYYVTFSTTAHGLTKIFRYLASVFPILTGFMVLGTCQFWMAPTFADFYCTYASLFSLLNGDMVHDSFDALSKIAGYGGHIYCYVFIFIFIYIVLNVNIIIIEEAYYAARFQGSKHETRGQSNERGFDFAPPSLHESESRDGARCSSSAVSLPNLNDDAKSSPLLRQRSSPELGRTVSMSPRFVNNPGLQEAMRVVFPDEFDTDAFCGAKPPMSPVPEESSSSIAMQQWSRRVSDWTHTLHSFPKGSPLDAADHIHLHALEVALAEHSKAVNEMAASLANERLVALRKRSAVAAERDDL